MIKPTFLIPAVLIIGTFCIPCQASDLSEIDVKPGEYLLKTEIIMPHLETNLRYATTNARRCLNNQSVSSFFPLLDHSSFVNCSLVENQLKGEYGKFDLVCLNAEAATGSAHFFIKKESIRATLYVKMGGKNMKFSQRISGQRIGSCN